MDSGILLERSCFHNTKPFKVTWQMPQQPPKIEKNNIKTLNSPSDPTSQEIQSAYRIIMYHHVISVNRHHMVHPGFPCKKSAKPAFLFALRADKSHHYDCIVEASVHQTSSDCGFLQIGWCKDFFRRVFCWSQQNLPKLV